MSDESLLEELATERQLEYIRAVEEFGSIRAAAMALGTHHSAISKSLQRLRLKAAERGYSPDEDAAGIAPEGYHVKGKSILYGADGEVKQFWLKTNKDAQKLEDFAKDIVDTLNIPLAEPITLQVRNRLTDQLTVYPFGDAHFGLFASEEETGREFNLEIAERELLAVVTRVSKLAPATKRAILVNVGDYTHTDNYRNRTERGNNPLDVAGRWHMAAKVGVRAMIHSIDLALRKHELVSVVNKAGNHDAKTAYMSSLILDAHYRNEPRVTVCTSPQAFHYFKFGKCLFGVTHGDRIKPADLPSIMAVDRAEDWGTTEFRYWLTGHVHHDQRKEFRGCMFESFRTMAASDAWHQAQGYRSGSDMKCIVYHKKHGEVLRHTVGLSRIV